MAEYIDYPAKLRSSRRDHKLVDATAIDGLIQGEQLAEDAVDLSGVEADIEKNRNGISLLQKVTRDLHNNEVTTDWSDATDANLGLSNTAIYTGVIWSSGAQLDRPDDGWPATVSTSQNPRGYIVARVPNGADVGNYRMAYYDDGDTDAWHITSAHWRRITEAPEDSTYDYYTVDGPDGRAEWGRIGSHIAHFNVEHFEHVEQTYYDGEFRGTFKDGIVPMEALAAAVQEAIGEGGTSPLIENVFDGMTGDTAGEQEVEGVAIENLANVAYSIRVGAETEFTLGNALRGVRSSSPLQVGHANFYTKANDDKLYRTLDSASDGTLEIWQVNDLAALRAALAASSTGGIAEGLALLEPLDGTDLTAGDVVLSDGRFHRYTDPSAPNIFAGVLGSYREQQTYYFVTALSTSQFGAHGRFTDNHDEAIGAVLVGTGTNNLMEVHIDKAVYETAKGSAVASGDEISAAFTGTVSGASTTTTHALTYNRTFNVHGKSWLSFEGQAANSVPKRIGTHADGWSLIVSQNGSVLLTHAIDGSHFTEYPIDAIDDYARTRADAALERAGGTMTGDLTLDGPPTANLHAATKAYVDDQVGGEATLGVRTESISFQAAANADTDVELSPIAADPVTVLHGEGDPEIITGVTGNDFTVAPGLYLLRIDGEVDADAVLRFGFDIRDAADDSIIVGPQEKSAYNTQGAYQAFTSTGYWHPTEAIEVNVLLERFGRSSGLRNVVMRFAQLNAQEHIHPHVIEPLEPLDTDEADDGEVVLSDHRFYQRAAADEVTEDTFAGELESWNDGADWIGTALAASRYGSRGRFTSNPDSKIGALTAGGDNPATVGLRLNKAAYETAKGSAVADGDTVWADISDTSLNNSVTELAYVRTESGGYLAFIAHDADCVLHDLDDGDSWFLRVLSAYDSEQGTSTALFEHDAETPHFNEYPIKAVDQTARDQAAEARTFARIIQPWEFVEPAGGIGFREVGRTALEARAEAVTGEIDTDRELVTALRATEQYGLRRALRIQYTAGYFLRKTQRITTSGAIGTVFTYLAVQRAGVADRNITRLDLANFTLDQFNAQYAAVGDELQYSAAADVTRPVDVEWTDFSDFDLEEGDVLVFRFVANAINGNALVKIEIDDLDISLGGGLASRIRSSAIHQDVVLTQAEYDALTVKDAHTRYNIVAG